MRAIFLEHATLHHEIALREATSILPHVTEDNCTEMYIFSVMTGIFTLRSPRKADDFLVFGDSCIAECFVSIPCYSHHRIKLAGNFDQGFLGGDVLRWRKEVHAL